MIEPGISTLRVAYKQYAQGNWTIAHELAERSILADDAGDEPIVLREFIIGAARIQEGLEIGESRSKRTTLQQAIPRLRLASRTWPVGREDEGERLLGIALIQIGDFREAAGPLRRVLGRNPAMRRELLPLLIRCLLRGNDSDLKEALEQVGVLLPLTTDGSPEHDEATRLRAATLLKLKRYDHARKALEPIVLRLSDPSKISDATRENLADEANLLLGSIDVAEAIERFGRGSVPSDGPRADVELFLASAMSRLAILQREAAPDISMRASLWTARGMLCSGYPDAALTLLTFVRQQQPFEGEAIAAGLEEIEWLTEAGLGEEVVQTVRAIVTEIGQMEHYDPSIIDLDEFRKRVMQTLQRLRAQHQFEYAVQISQTLSPVFPPADALLEEALTQEQWALHFASMAGPLPARSAAVAQSRQRFRAAGDAYASAAKLRFDTSTYPETLWAAIAAYQQGRHFAKMPDLLEDYLRYEDRRRLARGLLALGRVRLAAGSVAEALDPLRECIDQYPRDPLRYDARLVMAQAQAELNQIDEAKQLLEANLTDGSLTPASPTWRDSLYTLGELLYRESHETSLQIALDRDTQTAATTLQRMRDSQPLIEESIRRLQEAVVRYWPDKRAKHAAYLAAGANRMAAQWPLREAATGDVLESAKRQLRQQADQYLSAALSGFIRLRDDLTRREEEQQLDHTQSAMLRNCYLAEADTLFEMGRFEQAAESFRAVSLRYMNEPPALEAMLGQSRCLKQLGRAGEARMVIRQAAVVLSRIPPEWDDRFDQTTRYSRKRWQELLAWLDSSGAISEGNDA